MEPDCNYDEIKPSISTELAHKRVSELRQGNSATIAITLEEFETSVPLVNAPGTMEETTGAAIDGTGKNIDQVITSFKPTIFWKDKEIVKEQIKNWSLKKVENLIYKINEIELLIKKNSSNSINILFDFIITQSSKTNN